ncbi:MAG: peptidoglycan-associated lipoprotein Pal [Rhodobacteraceae bacterium HLUCCA08]|nr:MAG: peptidoglycan-associated lipoprotein Pal [Rhodobacteraceae bacterium HLUCCA08]
MNMMTKAALLIAGLGLAACTNPGRFDDANGVDVNGDGANAGIDSTTLDPAGDPRSPAYFNQTVGNRVLFAVDQSTLTDEAMQVLDGQAQWLQTNADYIAVIEGHADEQGTREYNIALGERRANAVRQYLVSQGVPAGRLQTVSYGKERPIATCSNESCYAQNRRAVTIISLGVTG